MRVTDGMAWVTGEVDTLNGETAVLAAIFGPTVRKQAASVPEAVMCVVGRYMSERAGQCQTRGCGSVGWLLRSCAG